MCLDELEHSTDDGEVDIVKRATVAAIVVVHCLLGFGSSAMGREAAASRIASIHGVTLGMSHTRVLATLSGGNGRSSDVPPDGMVPYELPGNEWLRVWYKSGRATRVQGNRLELGGKTVLGGVRSEGECRKALGRPDRQFETRESGLQGRLVLTTRFLRYDRLAITVAITTARTADHGTPVPLHRFLGGPVVELRINDEFTRADQYRM